MEISTDVKSHDTYYDSMKYSEPRQKLFAVMRYEKQSSSDSPGWIFKIITQDQAALLKSIKEAVGNPNSDGQGWVSNAEDCIVVEIIPSDMYIKKI